MWPCSTTVVKRWLWGSFLIYLFLKHENPVPPQSSTASLASPACGGTRKKLQSSSFTCVGLGWAESPGGGEGQREEWAGEQGRGEERGREEGRGQERRGGEGRRRKGGAGSGEGRAGEGRRKEKLGTSAGVQEGKLSSFGHFLLCCCRPRSLWLFSQGPDWGRMEGGSKQRRQPHPETPRLSQMTVPLGQNQRCSRRQEGNALSWAEQRAEAHTGALTSKVRDRPRGWGQGCQFRGLHVNLGSVLFF